MQNKTIAIQIEHDSVQHQFVASIDGLSATLKYNQHPVQKILDYYSTFVPPELRGRRIGQDLVKFALDYAIMNGYSVIPSCPFVKAHIDRHPEYQKVLQ